MTKYTTKIDLTYGHQVLEPIPKKEDLENFYRDTYYQLIAEGKRAKDIARSHRGGKDAENQAVWLQETLHKDIGDSIRNFSSGLNVLEVGCGLGLLMDDLKQLGFEVDGVDLGSVAVESVKARGYKAYLGSFEELVENNTIRPESYDAILFVNVLEQTFDPVSNLRNAYKALKPNGVVIVRSGNDFNPFQTLYHQNNDTTPFWVSPPEHIHYLTYDSMSKMMAAAGLDVVYKQSDFPMELFLLLGYDYTKDSTLGSDCHNRRVSFERALPTKLRRDLYQALAKLNLGRCMFVVGQKLEK